MQFKNIYNCFLIMLINNLAFLFTNLTITEIEMNDVFNLAMRICFN